jgi:hypothetical protein
MVVTFTIETANPDSNGDIVNLAGIEIPEKVFLMREFNHSSPLGLVEVIKTEDRLLATADIPDELLDCYPAIGFQVIKSHQDGKYRVFDEVKLRYVSLGKKPNPNPDIKTIREQLVG